MKDLQSYEESAVSVGVIEEDPDDVVEGLVSVGRALKAQGYRFTAVTPATHARVLARPQLATRVTDVFGWNRPFATDLLPAQIFTALGKARLLTRRDGAWVSRVRFSTIGNSIFAHGSFPTIDRDSVFFGPDTYRFVAALRRFVPRCDLLVDIGCGSGAGGIEMHDRAERVLLTDINDRALLFARANARLAGVPESVVKHSDLLRQVKDEPDVIVANPPYLADTHGRIYRDGGGELGTGLSVRILEESLCRLKPGGRLILYTGTPVVNGVDQFFNCIRPQLQHADVEVCYEEIDPDIFSEELEEAPYIGADRIAAVVLCLTRR